METRSFFKITSILLLVFCFGGCASQAISESFFNDKLEMDKKSPETLTIADSQVEPSLYHFILNSDYVLTALVTTKKPMSKTKKLEKEMLERRGNSNKEFSVSINDIYTGSLYSFQVEKIHYAKFDLETSTGEEKIISFQFFAPNASDSDHYSEGQRYLIFLKKQPNQQDFVEKYELDKQTTYFAAFRSESRYLSKNPSIGFKGIVDLAASENQEFAQKIETFCMALSEANINQKVRNLRNLAQSPDDILRANANYALKFLLTSEEKN